MATGLPAWYPDGMRALLVAAVLVFSACSGPGSRIRSRPDLFSSFSPEAQAKIRKGKIDIGFTPAMVEMAWGEPNRKTKSNTAEGDEVWTYGGEHRAGRSAVKGDAGFGSSSGGSYGGVGVGISVGGRDNSEQPRRVFFQAGKAVKVEE